MKAKNRIIDITEEHRDISFYSDKMVLFSLHISNDDLNRVRKKAEKKFKGNRYKQTAYSMKKISEMILNQY